MDIRRITDTYSVSPQIALEDLPAIAAAGFKTIVCNRPDSEVPPEIGSAAMAAAANAAGLVFVVHPLTHATMDDDVPGHMQILAKAAAPVLAYCASGTRCSIAWSLGHVGKLTADDILAATGRAGYDLSSLRMRLETED